MILHGYRAAPDRHWFGWLTEQLARDGIAVTIPSLPDSTAPVRDRWIETARGAIGEPSERLVIIGHSLGVVTGLHVLGLFDNDWRLGGFVSIAGACESIPALPNLDPFFSPPPCFSRTLDRTSHRLSMYSDDDDIVPPALSIRVAERLAAQRILIPGAQHFLGIQGWTQLPALLEWILLAHRADGG